MKNTGALQLATLDASTLEAVVETMLLAAHADGDFGPEEREEFARVVMKLTSGQLTAARFLELTDHIGKTAEADRSTRISALRKRLSTPALREGALELAIRVTAADAFIRTSERELILQLAEGLEVDTDKAADMIASCSELAGKRK